MTSSRDQTSAPNQLKSASPSPKLWEKINWPAISTIFVIISTILAALIGAVIYIESLFGELSGRIGNTETEIRKEINSRSNEQVNLIYENTKKLDVLEERVSNVRKDIDKIDKKIDDMTPIKRTNLPFTSPDPGI